METGPIVVGVDGTKTARKAADAAVALAASLGRNLHVVAAYDSKGDKVVDDSWAVYSDRQLAGAAVDEVAAEYSGRVENITTATVEGRPAEVLVSQAEAVDASTIVVGNRGVQGIGRILGSVGASVASHAPCDVYIVKTV